MIGGGGGGGNNYALFKTKLMPPQNPPKRVMTKLERNKNGSLIIDYMMFGSDRHNLKTITKGVI